MDLRDTLKIHLHTRRGLSDPPKGESFYKQKMVRGGHWQYMGHDIVREPSTRLWYIEPVEKRSNKAHPAQRTKDHHVNMLHREYIDLATTVIIIENERQNTK